ncbi:MAG: cysteine-rich CWC family protein [Bacillus sp. (in: Bacteria)]|nr:cysteine-rich CWC family protein [Bacillus sp. (in: firmicutes)]
MSDYKLNHETRQCPLCGGDNRCDVLNACWCSKESFPEGLLDLVPEELKNKACICKKCLQQYKESTNSGW